MLRPSGPLRLCRRQQKQQSSLFHPTGPPHARRRDTHSLTCLWEQSCASKGRRQSTVSPSRGPVSKTAPRSPRFPQAASTSSRRKRSINQFYSRFPSATCPQSLEALCRVNAVPTSGLLRPCRDPCPRSIPRSAFIPPHHQPTLPFSISARTFDPKQILWLHPPTLPCESRPSLQAHPTNHLPT